MFIIKFEQVNDSREAFNVITQHLNAQRQQQKH